MTIVDKLVTVVESNGYDGIQIDFEGVNASDADKITDFMKRLHGAFKPRGWIVSQAVIARTSDAVHYWGGAYDYSELAKYNDYIAIMAYDYGYAGRPDPIAVAPLWWVEDVCRLRRLAHSAREGHPRHPVLRLRLERHKGSTGPSVSYADRDGSGEAAGRRRSITTKQ